MNTAAVIPVTHIPLVGEQCREAILPHGLTVAEMVETLLPGLPAQAYDRVRVWLVNENGKALVWREAWNRARPRVGTRLLVRLVPGGKYLKSALSILVSVAAAALGQFWLGPLLANAGLGLSLAQGTFIASTALALAGNFLLNAVFPTKEPEKEKPVYSLAGWQNEARPDQPFPVIFGRHRYAPPYLAPTYFEVVEGRLYQRSLFCFGYGPRKVRDIKIGDTPIDKYRNVTIELREGWSTDDPVSLYDHQVIPTPENGGAELTRAFPRDDYGDIPSGAVAEEAEIVRQAAIGASEVELIFIAPAGMCRIDDESEVRSRAVDVRIRQREVGSGDDAWQVVEPSYRLSGRQREAVFWPYRWALPDRSKRWEIGITRLTDESKSTSVSDRVALFTMQSHRPEYPIAFDKPLCVVALRIKATHQLNGVVNRLNGVVSAILPDWDVETESWIERETDSPAAAYRAALQGPFVVEPADDVAIGLDQLAEWAEHCRLKGITYNRVHDFEESQEEMLEAIAAAGRASPHHDGRRRSVLIDRPQTLPIDHVNQGNSRNFSLKRTYFRPPHGFRVPFFDATNDFKAAVRIVPWPGHVGPLDRLEERPLPGNTDPSSIWVETRRSMYAAMLRPEVITLTQDHVIRAATRGDLVMGAWDTLDGEITVGAVRRVAGLHVTLSEFVAMEPGVDYAIRYLVFDDSDPIGQSVVRRVLTTPGRRKALVMVAAPDDTPLPPPMTGSLVHFGRLGSDSMPLVLAGIEPGEEMSQTLTLQPHAYQIDELADADEPPAWDGRVGEIKPPDLTLPAVPRFAEIASGSTGAGQTGRVSVTPQAGDGPGETVAVKLFRIFHRLAGAGSWTGPIVVPAGGTAVIDTYANLTAIELQATAVSYANVESDPTAVIPLTVGAGDAAIPAAFDEASISVVAKVGYVEILVASSDAATVAFQVWRDGSKLGDPVPISVGKTAGMIDGDSTRTNLFSNAGYDVDADWTKPAGLTIAAGKAVKAAGTAGNLTQAVVLDDGVVYRIGGTVSAAAAGTVKAVLLAGVAESAAFSGNGVKGAVLTAPSGSVPGFAFDAAADMQIDDAVLYRATLASVSHGLHTYALQPLNKDLVAGPTSAGRTVFAI